MPIHEQTVYPNRNKFTIPNVCKTVNTTKAANAIIIAFASVMVLSFFILFNISNFGSNYSAPPMGMSNRLTVVLQQELH